MDKNEIIQELRKLFSEMEEEYNRVADLYSFSCNGCTENCCTIGFQHYTLLEFELFKMGLLKFSDEIKNEIKEKAVQALELKKSGGNARCPMLLDNLCRMYEFRPMICRMHGVPYYLINPVKGTNVGDGCMVFQKKFQFSHESSVNRTPFFKRFAELEKMAREIDGFSPIAPGPRTIPDMILEIL